MNLALNLIQNYENNPNKVCLKFKNNKLTYKDLYFKTTNFGNYLKSLNIKKGDKVLVLVPMSIELYVTLISLWSIGAVPCFMDAGFIKNGMKNNSFDDIKAVIGITKYILYSNINVNLKKLKKINVKKIWNLNGNDRLDFEDLEDDFSGILTYTSGTTGRPKVAARSHEFLSVQGNILNNNLNYEDYDIELSTMPIFTLSNINSQITTVIADGNFANLGKSNSKKLVNQIINEKINRIMAAPGLMNLIIEYCKKNNIKLENVKKIFTGGGAIFQDYIENLKCVFPNAKIKTIYGSTEAEPIAHLNIDEMSEEDVEKIKNGYGILAGSIVGVDECKIINATSENIPNMSLKEFEKIQTDGIGEIVVSGANVLKGYVGGYGDLENKFSVDGTKFHRTGDLGFIDEKNRLWLRGRIKEPYFNIEAALHSKLEIGKTAIFKENDKLILVLEQKIEKEIIDETINFEKIDEIIYVKKIPVDKRHSTKVDYKELRKILKNKLEVLPKVK